MSDDKHENQSHGPINDHEEKHNSDEKKHKTPTETNYMESVNEMVSNPSRSNNTEETENQSRKTADTSGRNKTWLHVLFGGIIGGAISAIVVLFITGNGLFPTEQTSENISTAAEEEATPEVVQTIANEDTELSSSIEETSKAVVGVLNLRQQSIWEQSEEAGTGSGIIYKKDGDTAYVVTNQHVVDNAEEVEVVLQEEERLPAKVLGTDPLTDLAVLEVDGENIDTVATIGSSDDLTIGETVVAIGNPLGMEFANTLTKGIISGLERSVQVDTTGDGRPDWVTEVIQTDAAINPGNSGGALANAKGEVIGINSMKVARQEVEGIGFAIPIDEALPIIEQLETNEEVDRPAIGVTIAPLHQVPPQYRHEIVLPDDVDGGMVVADVSTGSPADKAGLQQFDIIVKINDQKITSFLELRKFLYSDASIGETVEIEYYRNGNLESTDLTLQAD
ncbi:S1C family serine protease [Virgibacillus kimchii]